MLTKIEQKRKNRYRYTIEELVPLHKNNNSNNISPIKKTKLYSSLTQINPLRKKIVFIMTFILIIFLFISGFFIFFPGILFNNNLKNLQIIKYIAIKK